MVKPDRPGAAALAMIVSIPLSGFLVVKRGPAAGRGHRQRRFNPFVGILGGQTGQLVQRIERLERFQSLCRDSWWSNLPLMIAGCPHCGVSIPLSGFLVVKLILLYHIIVILEVSIPLSGFLVVKRGHCGCCGRWVDVSIPLSGFLVVKRKASGVDGWAATVSIPLSGFLVVKPGC